MATGKHSFKVAIVGCGRIAGIKDSPSSSGGICTHAQAYRRNPNFTLDAAVDPDKKRLKQFRRIWSIPRGYATLKQLLDSGVPDVISLCTPNMLHARHIEQILCSKKRPRVVFAEKPVCLTREELNRLIRLERGSGCRVVVNHTRRFDPAHVKLSSIIKQKMLGRLLEGSCDYYGGWLNIGCHVVDTLRMLIGSDPRVETAEFVPKGRVNDICFNVTLRFKAAPVIIKAFAERYYQIFEIDLRFTKGRILIRDFGSNILIERVKVNNLGERVLYPAPASPVRGVVSPLSHAVNDISGYLEERIFPRSRKVRLEDSAGTMEILWQARELAIKGKK